MLQPPKFSRLALICSIAATWSPLSWAQAADADAQIRDCSTSILSGTIRGAASHPCEILRDRLGSLAAEPRLRAQTEIAIFDSMNALTPKATKDLALTINRFKPSSDQDRRQLARSLNTLASLQTAQKLWGDASKSYTSAMTMSKELGYTAGVVENLSSFSTMQLLAGDKGRSLRYAQKNIEYALSLPKDSIEDSDRILSSAYRALSAAALANARSDLALEAAVKAENHSQLAFSQFPDAAPLIASRNALAQLYLSANNFENALDVSKRNLPYLEREGKAYTKDLAAAFSIYVQALSTLDRTDEALQFAGVHAHKLETAPDCGEKIKALASTGVLYMQNTNEKVLARDLVVKAALISAKLFGPEAQTTTSLAELADSANLN